jgi:hypothetical protein
MEIRAESFDDSSPPDEDDPFPSHGETGEGGYAIVRDGQVEDTYMLLMS